MPELPRQSYAQTLREVADLLERHEVPRTMMPEHDTDADVLIDTVVLGYASHWGIRSSYGVVKVWSSRDGCMVAVAPGEARRIGQRFHEAMCQAADATERAVCGKQRAQGPHDA